MINLRSLIALAYTLMIGLAAPKTADVSPNFFSASIAIASFFEQGINATQAENFSVALQAFTQAINAKDHPTAAYANRCLVEIQLQQYEAAVSDCTIALNQSSKNPEAYLNRGLAEYRLGNYAAAIIDNTHLLQLQPNDLRAYANRGLAEAAINQHELAIADYTAALSQSSALEPTALADIYRKSA